MTEIFPREDCFCKLNLNWWKAWREPRQWPRASYQQRNQPFSVDTIAKLGPPLTIGKRY